MQVGESEYPLGRLVFTTVASQTGLSPLEIAKKSHLIFLIHDRDAQNQMIRSSQTLEKLGLDHRDVVLMDLPEGWLQDHSSPVLQAYNETRLYDFNEPEFSEWNESTFFEKREAIIRKTVRLCADIQALNRSTSLDSLIDTLGKEILQKGDNPFQDLQAEESEKREQAKTKLIQLLHLTEQQQLSALFTSLLSQHPADGRLIVFCKKHPVTAKVDSSLFNFVDEKKSCSAFDISNDLCFQPGLRVSPRDTAELT